uniref:DUF1905 domain-containing protein n=1 Tax=uncultured Actinomycetes bacterium TaxID=152507 RepID=A0A871XYU9_9ACTN|nr:hypothetical protein HULAa55C9_00008 [uncultured Actinomycetes bacterium]QOV09089.1 hypothetical protein HULAa32G3_00009 [uncultured Actinomycetes bacterium]
MSETKVTYQTTVLGFGNHAAIEIPDDVREKLGGSKKLPLNITVNKHTYRATSTGMDGKCLVVFPQKERNASGAGTGDVVFVTLELELGRREVEIPQDLQEALETQNVLETFQNLSYSKRREFVRQVEDAKTEATRERRIHKVVAAVLPT